MLITPEVLENNGYKKFITGLKKRQNPESYICSFQKCISDNAGKKYFITLHYYENHFQDKYQKFFAFQCQFKNKNKRYVDINLHLDEDMPIEEVESFYEEIWANMRFRYYAKTEEL